MKCFLAISAITLAAAGIVAHADPWILKTSSLTVTFDPKAADTITTVDYGGYRAIVPAGGQGAVIMGRKDGIWTGSAMDSDKPEEISSFTVSADQTEFIGAPTTLKAGEFSVRKVSKMGPLEHVAETTISGDVIQQTHRFTAAEDTDLKTFYAFIYSLEPKAGEWLAQASTGEPRNGSFKQDGGHPPGGENARWLAQFNADTGKGTLAFAVSPMVGRASRTEFWDTKGYHKLLMQPFSGPISKGTELEYSLVLRFFTAESATWKETAAQIGKKLMDKYPYTEPQKSEPSTPRIYDEGVPEAGLFTCRTGKYTTTFAADRAWTIHSLKWNDAIYSHANGFHGTVLTPKGGKWWGTGHSEGGREVVHSLTLEVDGKPRSFEVDADITCQTASLIKESTIWKFNVRAEVHLSADGIVERTKLVAFEDTDLQVFYMFMHCFIPDSTRWLAELPDGTLKEGELPSDGGFEINTDTRWAAQFFPESAMSVLCYTPRVISGQKSMSKIWDLERYHKYYLQRCTTESFTAGDELDYTVVVKIVPDEDGTWNATKTAASALKATFPPINEPEE